MSAIHFLAVPKLICAPGSLSELAGLCEQAGWRHALIVTDPGIVASGFAERAAHAMRKGGTATTIFDQVAADPPYSVVRAAVQLARNVGCDCVVGLGGGSSIDTAKVVSVSINSEQSLDDMVGNDRVEGNRLPLVAIPTTAGTGSEVTFVSVLTNDANEKRAIFAPQLMPDIALLDAELTLGMPRHVTAATALDAMVHCIEAFTSRTRKNPISDAVALKGLALLVENFPIVLSDGKNLQARNAMLLGATLAGMAFINASVGAVHGLSYPLGARFHVPHGHSNALVMGAVFRFNLPAAAKEYAELAPVVLPGKRFSSPGAAADAFVSRLEEMLAESGLETRLSALGVTEADVEPMAEEVTQKITRLIAANPRDMNFAQVCSLYRSVM
ncbi:iron-containing alcohol dehydrogenase [Bradyrhizobium mercantei]|uniref:iron-containing alcohol dehydrogenase n=1 Tax=Bradyrhizobium mercantei TaxID=1904807 RepID=UPI0009756A41|nr:iron-containing alcohol dehydrogenase [Bradyrhizobium mercantei]